MIFVNYRTNFNSSFANRGMALENDINETNKYYREYDIALVYKKPTPIRITKTNYQNMRITDGFFECPSTLDYNGVYKGYYICIINQFKKIKLCQTNYPQFILIPFKIFQSKETH